VANVTGLDRIGIPVYMVTRPNSRSLAVSQGKGVTPMAAKVSGIMESVELHHAEFNSCLTRLESYVDLKRQVALADPELLPLARDSLYAPRAPLAWTEGFDLIGKEPVWVPYELVHSNATVPPVPGSGCFTCTTNGLASGNTLAEAVLHGLCEVIERDCNAVWEHSPTEHMERTRVDLHTVNDPVCLDLLARFTHADVSVVAWDMTSDVGLPVFRALISDCSRDAVLRPIPAVFGFGCHTDRGVALSRALTEAAQSRLTTIAGSRDDLTRRRYRLFQAPDALEFLAQLAVNSEGHRDFCSAPSMPSATLEEDIVSILGRLQTIGIERVVVVDLSRRELPCAVARVVVPGLEGPIESPSYWPGPRVRALRR
jgi:ribosomal protein S12 methylthiotransferase accessory factor